MALIWIELFLNILTPNLLNTNANILKFAILYILIIIFLLPAPGTTQTIKQYNLNHFSGLPSNHVYCMLADKYGYLFIGTNKGVVKYNGYSLKQYSISDPDVWDLYEDKNGRIWLYRISDELGYIHHDKYQKVNVKSTPIPYIYPKYLTEFANRIIFISSYGTRVFVNLVYNDTLHTYRTKIKSVEGNTIFLSSALKMFHIRGNELFQVQIKGMQETASKKWNKSAHNRISMLGNYLLLSNSTSQLSLVNTNTFADHHVNLEPRENIQNTYHNKGREFILTNKNLYVLEDTFTIAKYNLLNYLTESQLRDNSIVYVIQDSFWNTCISTVRSGLYMSMRVPHFKKLLKEKIPYYKYIGIDINKTLYWWSDETHKLAAIDDNGQINQHVHNKLDNVQNIIPYKADKMILVSRSGFHTYNIKSSKINNLFDENNNYRYFSRTDRSLNHYTDSVPVNSMRLKDGIAGTYNKDVLTAIVKGGYLFNYKIREDTLIQTELHASKYIGLTYDSVLDCAIAYDNKSIFINKKDKVLEFKNIINHLEIKRIKNLCIDQKYGNVFFQGGNKIVVYNYYTNKLSAVLNNYKLDKVEVRVYNNMLIVAGRFGILFENITGPLRFSSPVVYQNTKSLVYNEVIDIATRGNHTIINTDSGLLFVENPAPDLFNKKSKQDSYNLIVSHSDTMYVVHTGDTLFLNQEHSNVLFDIVKPTGVGLQKFHIKQTEINNQWQELNANEFYPTKYSPGQYYHLQVQAEDDIWRSAPTKLVIYLQPYWWQSSIGKTFIAIGSYAAIFILILIVVYYTGKLAIKSHIKKNYLLSLELRSIYAQINPHFIFNTLTTGLYFISENRNKDAYSHISSFSELLRSYIKSARNKYITLAEEIENIENYINLQQYRFEDRFDYSIDIDKNIDIGQKRIPGLLLQPFVENAINHGLLYKKEKGHLVIKIISTTNENTIYCIVEDNGIGRVASKRLYDARKNKPESYGNELIQDLIKIINADNQLRIDLHYVDLPEPLTGTRVVITVMEVHHE